MNIFQRLLRMLFSSSQKNQYRNSSSVGNHTNNPDFNTDQQFQHTQFLHNGTQHHQGSYTDPADIQQPARHEDNSHGSFGGFGGGETSGSGAGGSWDDGGSSASAGFDSSSSDSGGSSSDSSSGSSSSD